MLAPQGVERYHSSADVSSGRLHDREDDVQAASDKIGGHLFAVQLHLIVEASAEDELLARASIRQMAGAFGTFTTTRLATFRLGGIRREPPRYDRSATWIASHTELATLVHPPTASAAAERMQTQEFTELEAPVALHSHEEAGAAVLGRVRFRNDCRIAAVGADDLKRHVYVVGGTGCGKSTLLLNQIRGHMEHGSGLTVIDVHGDLIEAALGVVPAHRTNDVVVFDAAGESMVPFNPLSCSDVSRVDQVTSGVVSAFRKLYDSWGPRLESLLRFAVYATVEAGGTLQSMVRFLTDEGYRDQVVPHIRDDVARTFWMHEFQSWNRQYRTEAVSSVTNKVLPFLANSRLRAITSDSAKSLDMRSVIDDGRILLVNLSRGRLGQDNATLLGSLMLTSIEQAALARADIEEEKRRTHHIFLDEFQSIISPSIAILLSEGRKFGVSLTLSHQMTSQLNGPTLSAVLGNCGTLVAFRVGLEDADALAPAFSKFPGQLKPQDMTGLPNFTAYVRLLVDGVPTAPFSLTTMTAPVDSPGRRVVVRAASNRRYRHSFSRIGFGRP
jgi:energy-coupling factor transporter ATP-binding protein EcfA2